MADLLGKYEILNELGSGAFATVYRARDTLLARLVALKVLKPAFMADEASFARFVREAQVTANLFHPHIATVLDMGEADGRHFIAMRYVDGLSLDKVLAQRGPLPWAEALKITEEIASALDFAHARGLIHRDVKPQNIIISQSEGAVLTDFGLVKAIQSTALTTATGAMLGTPSYIPPEIWLGQAATPASDQYALACVIAEMLTGQPLFVGKSAPAIMTLHVLNGPEFPAAWPDGVPPNFTAILQRSLIREPASRYASVIALAQAMRPSTEPPAPAAVPGGDVARAGDGALSKPQSKTPWGLILATVAVLGVLIIMAGLIFRPVPPSTPTQAPAIAAPVASPTMVVASATPPPTPEPPTNTPHPTAVPTLGIGSTRIATDGMTLLYVPASEFTMGSNDGEADEKPPHLVYLDAFWIDQTEVTNAMFKKFIDATHYQTDAEKQGNGYVFDTAKKTWSDTQGANWQHPRGPSNNLTGLDNHPAVQVSWNDATTYCIWAGGDLPTEAQWEKAARGPSTGSGDQRTYPWGDAKVAGNLLNSADHNLDVDWADKSIDDGYQFTAPVGHYPDGVSPYGALDMAGNVWEWMRDWYDDKYYASSPARNPENTTKSDAHVLRGGSWNNEAANVRASNRLRSLPVNRDEVFGFRCARDIP
jgi:eukaryotic-like serine/threonine-protein kinase